VVVARSNCSRILVVTPSVLTVRSNVDVDGTAQVRAPPPSSCGRLAFADAVATPSPVLDGETLQPTVADVLISFASFPAAAAAASYVSELLDKLSPGVNVFDALDRLNQGYDRKRVRVAHTCHRPIVFPRRR